MRTIYNINAIICQGKGFVRSWMKRLLGLSLLKIFKCLNIQPKIGMLAILEANE